MQSELIAIFHPSGCTSAAAILEGLAKPRSFLKQIYWAYQFRIQLKRLFSSWWKINPSEKYSSNRIVSQNKGENKQNVQSTTYSFCFLMSKAPDSLFLSSWCIDARASSMTCRNHPIFDGDVSTSFSRIKSTCNRISRLYSIYINIH